MLDRVLPRPAVAELIRAPGAAGDDLRDAMAIRRQRLTQELIVVKAATACDDDLHGDLLSCIVTLRVAPCHCVGRGRLASRAPFPGHAPWMHTGWCTAVAWRPARRAACLHLPLEGAGRVLGFVGRMMLPCRPVVLYPHG